MMTLDQSLVSLTARDLMKSPVVTIPQEMSLCGAARLLQRERISGAPVVNAERCCVGVLSTTDFLKWTDHANAGQSTHGQTHPEVCSEWQVIDPEALPHDEVRYHMSIDVVTCVPTVPVARLARLMIDAHIHRIFVLDAHRRPVGVVSSTDILAAVARLDVPTD